MVWRESFPPANELTLDAEAERERRLAAQARAGADWALAALVARYQPAVTRYLTRLCGDQGRARVLAERVFQRMERRLHGPHGGENLRLWLLRASTEAGLEAIRRPRKIPTPRLDVTRVAGLLPAEAGAQAQSVIKGGMKRLRKVAGAVSRQARPLVWKAPAEASRQSGSPAVDGASVGPVDEGPDSLDPYEALRHRLIRITLAELPYGDAQCLALHLVAGLNQAEVARALGITGSAARRRIVQGLGQFSTRYRAAVQTLGLPDELGYGDALPPVRVEELPLFAPPEEPVVVPEIADEPITEALPATKAAPSTAPLTIDSFDATGSPTSGVAFYATSADDIPTYQSTSHPPLPPGPDEFFTLENQQVFEGSYDDAFTQPYAGPYAEPAGAAQAQPFPEPLDDAVAGQDDTVSPVDEFDQFDQFDHFDSTHVAEPSQLPDGPDDAVAGGGITRIASDAIVGPVVDALPVDSEPVSFPPGYGSPNARSMPLSYELISGVADLGGITMNLFDSDGTMAPLSFEADATEVSGELGGVAPGGHDDPWAASAILDLTESQAQVAAPVTPAFESQAEGDGEGDEDAARDESVRMTPGLDITAADTDYAWERAREIPAPERIVAPSPIEARSLNAEALDATPPAAQPESAARPRARTLEDLWDEPDGASDRSRER